jgi:hypothetical protein
MTERERAQQWLEGGTMTERREHREMVEVPDTDTCTVCGLEPNRSPLGPILIESFIASLMGPAICVCAGCWDRLQLVAAPGTCEVCGGPSMTDEGGQRVFGGGLVRICARCWRDQRPEALARVEAIVYPAETRVGEHADD